jgi:phage terminase large subunit
VTAVAEPPRPSIVAEDPPESEEQARKTAERIALANEEMKRGAEFARAPDAKEKAAEAARIAGTPVGFAVQVLGLALYVWQAIVLSWFENTLEMVKGSLCTPNGAGKSERIVATLALWWITVHPQGRVVITTKDSKQLDNQIWPAIERHKGKFPCYDFIERMVRNGTGGFIIGFTTDDPGRAEGWHKIDDYLGPLLIIGDEAKSIADAIHMALDRCTYNAKLLTSSPGLTEGLFYRSQTELAGKKFNAQGFVGEGGCPDGGFMAMKVGLIDCPHIPESRIKNIIQTYGPDHWFTRSTLHAEFTDVDSDTLFIYPKHIVREVMDNPPKYVPGSQCASCDFAAGRAENVFTHKRGNRIEQVCWKDPDPMRAVGQFIALFIERSLLPSEIDADAGGMGIPILARFNELGWPINGINNESEPIDPDKYPSLGAENWHDGAIKLARRKYIIPNDPILFKQLTGRRAAPTSKAILGYESKKEMAKRGFESPDRADGLVMVLARDEEAGTTLFDQEGMAKLESLARANRAEVGSLDLGGDRIQYERRNDGWLSVFERPIIGFSYLCVVNPHRHDEPMKNHSLMIVRAPYWDDDAKEERPARLVAKVRTLPFRLDARPLAAMIAKLAGWYGNCMVVPIVNDRGDVIDRLMQEGCQLYSREEYETLGHGRQRTFEFGWESDDFTRSLWIGALSDAIREDSVIVEDVPTVMQLFQLHAKDAKRMRDAEGLGVALQLINYATVFSAPIRAGERDSTASQYS